MNILEYLDRRDQRRMEHPRHKRDIRQFIGFVFLLAYYGVVFVFIARAVPTANVDLIRDAMLTLGPPVGIIIAAMFRTDMRDEQATENTHQAFRAVEAAARAGVPTDRSAEAAREVAKAADDKADEFGDSK